MWDRPPLGQMTTGELDGCVERTTWLLEHKQLMPHDLFIKLETWHIDMQAEAEDRADLDATARGRATA
jgi:hypothetical protein